MRVSVVIITKNEERVIANTIRSLEGLSDDVLVVDNGSTDNTMVIARELGAKVIETAWLGYGPTKNIGIEAAKYEWVLNLDADEAIDATLYTAIKALDAPDVHTVYNLRFKNFFCDKWLRFGEWGTDRHIRLFNKTVVGWNDAEVHESLLLPSNVRVAGLPGYILHYTVSSLDQYIHKTVHYAKLNASKYAAQGRKTSLLKIYCAPLFSFIHNYLIRLGFLDGYEGYLTAKTTAWYTFLKYAFLREHHKKEQTDSLTGAENK